MARIDRTHTDSPRVTIVTVTYAAGAFAERYVAAIRAQTFRDWECLIVDDGSPDSTVSRLQHLIAGDPRFHVFAREHAGHPAPNRQFALQRARGQYVALCDQDDFWAPQKLETQLRAFALHPDTVLCHTDRLMSELGGRPQERSSGAAGTIVVDSPERALYERCAITCSSVMAPLSQVRAVGGFHESLKGVDDYHLWLRLCTVGSIVWVQEPLLVCTLHDSNMSASPATMARGLRDMVRALEDERAPPHIRRIARAQACKASAVAAWIERPFSTVALLLRSLLARPCLRTAQLLIVAAASCVITASQRRKHWQRIVARRRRGMLAEASASGVNA